MRSRSPAPVHFKNLNCCPWEILNGPKMKNEKYCALGGKKSNAIRRSSSHKQQVLGGCYALILPYFCHESNFLFSRNMICQKMRNTVCLVERNPMQQEKAGNCSVTLWLWEGEEGGRVARFQSPTKVVVAQFWIFLATHWTFLWTFWGFFKFWQCTGAGDLLLTSGKD